MSSPFQVWKESYGTSKPSENNIADCCHFLCPYCVLGAVLNAFLCKPYFNPVRWAQLSC